MTLNSSWTELPRRGFALFSQVVEGENVGFREIVDMHIIPNASAIWCRIVAAKNLQCLALSQYGFEGGRNEARFPLMNLTDFSALVGSCSIEVTKRDRSNAIGAVVGTERVLEKQF
jgi:hypothetical protein